jgi:hypothetical protein
MAARLKFTSGRRSVSHTAETDTGNLKAGFAKVDVVHYFSCMGLRPLTIAARGKLSFSEYKHTAPTPIAEGCTPPRKFNNHNASNHLG